MKVYVLLMAHNDWRSRLIHRFTGGIYTHASIGLSDCDNLFYSFVIEDGFKIERPTKTKKIQKLRKKCALFEIQVSEEQYLGVLGRINEFILCKNKMHYSFSTLFCCLFHIPCENKTDGYICSQFTAEILSTFQIIKAYKNTAWYLPDDFTKIPELKLSYEGDVKGLAEYMGESMVEVPMNLQPA